MCGLSLLRSPKVKWYKRDPDAWRAGVVNLSPAERGIYDTVIDTLYGCDLKVPPSNDDKYWARACNCDPRVWRRLRDSLLAKGKLYLEDGGGLMATRVRVEWELARRRIEVASELRQKQLWNQRLIAGSLSGTTTTTKKERGSRGENGHASSLSLNEAVKRKGWS